MPKDFRVDMETGNVYLDRLVEGVEFTQQSLWIRLSLWLKDWFLDASKGIEWELGLSYQPPRLAELFSQIRTVVLGTHGVTEITRFNPTTEGRKLTLELRAATIYGEEVSFDRSFGT